MNLSQYAKSLTPLYKCRYCTKIEDIGIDPYLLKYNQNNLPKNIKICNIFDYLITNTSCFTGNPMNNNMSIKKAQDLFEAGWLTDVGGRRVKNIWVVLGKVLHSQKLREKPLEAWVIINTDGAIISAHCKWVNLG